MKLRFHDFAPRQLKAGGLLSHQQIAAFDDALLQANEWLDASGVVPVNVETVVLPNMWREEGTTDGMLHASGEHSTHWYQIVRVWYRA